MTRKISKILLNAWREAVVDLSRLSKGEKEDPNLAANVRRIAKDQRFSMMSLREVFTEDRELIDYRLLNKKENVLSYVLAFHLPNAHRILKTLERLEQKWGELKKMTSKTSLNVWDLGCGSGAFTHALMDTYARAFEQSRAYMYDTNSVLLDVSKTFLSRLKIQNIRSFPRKVSLQDLNTQPKLFEDSLHIVGLSYVWNEVYKNRNAQKKVFELLRHFEKNKAHALVFLMEPGQEDPSRKAMEFRDQLVEEQWTPLYPCPHQKSCPMLKRSKDWCYSEFSAEALPKDVEAIDGLLGVNRSIFASSAYVFASSAFFESLSKKRQKSIVVGRPLDKKEGAFSYLLCKPEGVLEKTDLQGTQRFYTSRGEAYSIS